MSHTAVAIADTSSHSFTFLGNRIRVAMFSGEPWFVASDICKAIGIKNPTMALKPLDDNEVSVINATTVSLTDGREKQILSSLMNTTTLSLTEGRENQILSSVSGAGAQSINLVSESGMYTIILRCRDAIKSGTPAHKFKRWVTNEVLPAIRKTGSYSKVPTEKPKTIHPRDYQELRLLLDQAAACTGYNYKSTYTRLLDYFKIRFSVNKLNELPVSSVDLALEIAQGKLELMEKWRDEQKEKEAEFIRRELVEGVPSLNSLKRNHQSEFSDGMPDQEGWLRIWKSERQKKAKDDVTEATELYSQLSYVDKSTVIALIAELRGGK